ncbi:hypothetical protein LXA43DRAFT_278975 [Ganoderma leucocontextum]|nr:hypothetical protein LXA43DRAFT_278975 [Ganoderma leucocontextum]
MRLSSTTSSLFLATLAVSSSSTALAAPTEPNALDEAIDHSSSNLQLIAMAGRSGQVTANLGQTPSDTILATHVQEIIARTDLLETLGGLLGGLPVLGPILGPLLQKLASLVNGLGLPIDALQKDGADAQSVSSLTPDQIRTVAQAISDAHTRMQAAMAQDGSLHARGQIAQWDAVPSSPPSSSSSSDAASATSSSSSGVPMQRSQTAPATSGSATSSANGIIPTLPPLPIQPPNTPILPTVPIVPTAPKVTGIPIIVSLAPRMVPPVFIKAGQNKVEVSLSDGPATTFTANSSSTANLSSTATPTGSQATAFTSAAVANSTSTVFPSDSMFSRTHTM